MFGQFCRLLKRRKTKLRKRATRRCAIWYEHPVDTHRIHNNLVKLLLLSSKTEIELSSPLIPEKPGKKNEEIIVIACLQRPKESMNEF